MGGVIFALKEAGIPGSALDWYGDKGKIVWLNDKAESNARKYFDIIAVKTKTVRQCMEDGTLRPGDIITYMTITHTNAYYSNNKSYDTGHAFCNGSGEGAEFTKWIGTTPYKDYKIAYIIRLKGACIDKVTQKLLYFRVQIGAMNTEQSARLLGASCTEKTKPLTKDGKGLQTFYEKMSDGKWHVFCGSFINEAGANERLALIKKPNLFPNAFIKQIYV